MNSALFGWNTAGKIPTCTIGGKGAHPAPSLAREWGGVWTPTPPGLLSNPRPSTSLRLGETENVGSKCQLFWKGGSKSNPGLTCAVCSPPRPSPKNVAAEGWDEKANRAMALVDQLNTEILLSLLGTQDTRSSRQLDTQPSVRPRDSESDSD